MRRMAPNITSCGAPAPRTTLKDRPMIKETTARPREGEVWRNDMGAIREVRSVDEDGYSVTYSRPAPAHPDWRTVLMADWELWVESTNAVRRRKAGQAKDWSYING